MIWGLKRGINLKTSNSLEELEKYEAESLPIDFANYQCPLYVNSTMTSKDI